jgi:hypothetical protein
LAALLQILYLGWMLNAPDWASVRVVMFVFALVATAYAVVMAAAMGTPIDHPMLLGMGEVRRWAVPWCGLMVGLMSLATYLCARTSTQWRRSIGDSRPAVALEQSTAA